MGWTNPASGDVVIVEAIGPGPNAEHGMARFVPDYAYHEAEIARLYQASDRQHVYLGDWHSHPGASDGSLSFKDRQTLRRIADSIEARAGSPLMTVLFGARDSWQEAVWRGEPVSYWRALSGVTVCSLKSETIVGDFS